jgi:hypothetical protein
MNTEANPNTEGSTPNPAAAEGATEGNASKPQEGSAPAPDPTEGQGAKPDGATTTEGDKPKDEPEGKDKPEGEAEADPFADDPVPEQYESFTLPADFTLEGQRLEDFTALAKRSGWGQKQAQSVIDKFTADVTAGLGDQFAAQVERWGTELKADPEFGGAGFEANLSTAGKFVAEVGGKALVEDLDRYGLGNLPSLNKFALNAARREADLRAKLAIATGEPSSIPGNGATAQPDRPLHERMYPNMK